MNVDGNNQFWISGGKGSMGRSGVLDADFGGLALWHSVSHFHFTRPFLLHFKLQL